MIAQPSLDPKKAAMQPWLQVVETRVKLEVPNVAIGVTYATRNIIKSMRWNPHGARSRCPLNTPRAPLTNSLVGTDTSKAFFAKQGFGLSAAANRERTLSHLLWTDIGDLFVPDTVGDLSRAGCPLSKKGWIGDNGGN
jgi:hypothetical protein